MTRNDHNSATPAPASREDGFGGVHDPSFFHDGCGVACVARLDGKAIHETIDRALVALDRLEHRGAAGADESTGDGAGIMFGLPHEFFRSRTAEIDTRPVVLPGPGRLGVAMCFMRRDSIVGTERIQRRIGELVAEAGHTAIGWRQVPVDETSCGELARRTAPRISQLFIEAGDERRRRDGVRPQPVRGAAPRRARVRGRRLLPEHVLPDDRLQGNADGAAAAAVLSGSPRPLAGEARSRSSTRASRPTRRRAGSWRSRCG